MFAIKTSRPQEDQVKHLYESFQLHDVTHLHLFFFTGSNESQYVMEEHATRLQQRRAEVTNQSFPLLNSFLFKLTFYYRFKRTLKCSKETSLASSDHEITHHFSFLILLPLWGK